MFDRRPTAIPLRSLAAVAAALALGASACGGGGGSSAPAVDQANTCGTGCTRDQDCGTGQWCSAGKCRKLTSYCSDATTSHNDLGASADCTPFACDATTGRCFTTTGSSNECAPSWPYDGQGHCALCSQNGCTLVGGAGPTSLGDAAAITCSAACAHDRDCGSANMCWQGKCVYLGNYCAWSQAQGWAAVAVDGALQGTGDYGRVTTGCGSYACDPIVGQCYTRCFNTFECNNGLNCDPTTFTCK